MNHAQAALRIPFSNALLKAAGVDPSQAKAHRIVLAELAGAMNDQVATKADITSLETKFELLRSDVKAQIAEGLNAQTWKLLGGVAVLLGIVTAVDKLWH
jgi:hypothetical protein